MPKITIISMYNGRCYKTIIKRAEQLCQLAVDGRVVYDDELDESNEYTCFRKTDPFEDYKTFGFKNAVVTTKEGIKKIKFGLITSLIVFGDKIGAIIERDFKELILIQIPDGEQLILPVIELPRIFQGK